MLPVVLIILDGWGVAPASPGNAIAEANLPFYLKIQTTYPHGLLRASGEAVGLPRGENGNTETGHLNIGAGRIVYQDLPRIDFSIADGSFFDNQEFIGAINHCIKNKSKLHIMGLIGAGGVHSNNDHLLALLQLMKEKDFKNVFLHLITDGRDSPPQSALLYIQKIKEHLGNIGFGQIASISGRYYSMDRDSRWDRIQKSYDALTVGLGNIEENVEEAINNSYNQKIYDEFILPTIISKNKKPIALVEDNDSFIFFNFRIDRPRELTKAFVMPNFETDANKSGFDPFAVRYHQKHSPHLKPKQEPFKRTKTINNLYFVTMTEYSKDIINCHVAFPPWILDDSLGKCISNAGYKQLRLSESEKERFVTYYFNGQNERPYPGEDHIIVPSPLVPTYDMKPEMSVFELSDVLYQKLSEGKYQFYAVNMANPDMVAHTGNIAATKKACEAVDKALEKVITKVLDLNGTAFITADHGNAEELIDIETGGINTEHSSFPVPFIAVNKKWEWNNLKMPLGVLADIAPTILHIMDIKQPIAMTGRNLLKNVID